MRCKQQGSALGALSSWKMFPQCDSCEHQGLPVAELKRIQNRSRRAVTGAKPNRQEGTASRGSPDEASEETTDGETDKVEHEESGSSEVSVLSDQFWTCWAVSTADGCCGAAHVHVYATVSSMPSFNEQVSTH